MNEDKMFKAKISEIFRSIQGEGKYLGADQIFVRFSGCNLSCGWCDTPASRDKSAGLTMDALDLLSAIARHGSGWHSVSLTGGEPLLQSDFLLEFLPQLKKKPERIFLETNGTLFQALEDCLEYIDIISMDFKLPCSTNGQVHWDEHRRFLKIASQKEVYVKAVISKHTVLSNVAMTRDLIKDVDPGILLILQPNSLELDKALIEKCTGFQRFCADKLKDVRVIPQVHKIMAIR
ncbi:MAG: 7-carboxy-7-deazaguanine synthase QueE [Candidatus Omnitrophica bacterium]|nr:7-carboxy-7-deazaguanine synthase QueE [Candidatus Omnitrophota bacterium]